MAEFFVPVIETGFQINRNSRSWYHTRFYFLDKESRFKKDLMYKIRYMSEYVGGIYSWKTRENLPLVREMSICSIPILEFNVGNGKLLLARFPSEEEILSTVKPDLFLNKGEFHNRMRLAWRRLGLNAVRYGGKTKVISEDDTPDIFMVSGDTLHLNETGTYEKNRIL